MKKLLLTLLLIPNLVMAETFLCIAENSAGINQNYGKSSFTSEIFKPNEKYIVKNYNNNWQVNRFGQDEFSRLGGQCEESKLSLDGKVLECDAYFGSFTMSIEKLRYVHTRTGDYTYRERNIFGSALVEYGSCSSI